MNNKVICYICADLSADSSLRKLRKFTTCAARRGYSVTAIWPGCFWQNSDNAWRLNFFKVFNHNDFCAIVLDGEYFHDENCINEQLEAMYALDIPLIAMDINLPGFVSVSFDMPGALEAVIAHVVREHECRNVLFFGDSTREHMAAEYSEVFRKYLEKENIEDIDDRIFSFGCRIGCGSEEAVEVIRQKKPDAIICSDNTVANMASSAARTCGLSIPDDIVITGLNGIAGVRAGIPDLTGCNRNLTLMVDKCMELIEKALHEEKIENVILPTELLYSESCGCKKPEEYPNVGVLIRHLTLQREMTSTQQRRQIGMVARLIKTTDKAVMCDIFRDILPANTYLCLRGNFVDDLSGEAALKELSATEKFLVVSAVDRSLEGKFFDHDFLREHAVSQGKNAAPLILYPVYAREEYYGFVASENPTFYDLQMMMQAVLIALNNAISYVVRDLEVRERNEEIRDMNDYLDNIHYRDAMTGMLNAHGLAVELENCKADCVAKRQTMHVVCVDLDHLGNINDVYGHSEGDYAILELSKIINESASREDLTAHIGSDEFIVVIRTAESKNSDIDYFINHLRSLVTDYNKESNKEYTLNVNVSTSMILPYEDTDMVKVIDEALLNKRITKNNRKANVTETEEMTESEIKQSGLIKEIIDNNRFRYAFQPIVDAKTGKIFAYEALMRTDADEKVSPLTILKYATANQRLYDIERATFFNVLKAVEENRDRIKDRKIFLNSIPGFQLDRYDYERLKTQYPDHLQKFFIEITEQAEQDDEELRVLTERSNKDGFSIAIDDYGVGYANTTSLLRYTPNCVKIDRLLIQNLQDDPRKQHFVKNIIEFAHDNHFYALAEGVETTGELKASIMLGADLIQGFYTARPDFEIADSIPDVIQDEILECNRAPEEQRFTKLYVVSREKELILTRIALEMYTDILISGQDVILNGNADYPAAVKIRIKENTDSTLTIRNIILDNEKDDVGIEIGENATLNLILDGDNYINSNGIRVPATSSLKIMGNGNLHIRSRAQEAFGIGNDLQHPFGSIITDISGNLEIDLNGEKAVAIGGCVPGPNAQILMRGGDNLIKAKSAAFVGIGAFSGMVKGSMTEMHLAINFNVVNGIAIGSPSGTCNLHFGSLLLEIKGGGKSITGLGCAAKGENQIEIVNAEAIFNMNAPRVIVIGCALGHSKFYSKHSRLEINGSGGQVLGIGTTDMGGEIILESVGCTIKLSSDRPLAIGAEKDKCDFGASDPEISIINYSAHGDENFEVPGRPPRDEDKAAD